MSYLLEAFREDHFGHAVGKAVAAVAHLLVALRKGQAGNGLATVGPAHRLRNLVGFVALRMLDR